MQFKSIGMAVVIVFIPAAGTAMAQVKIQEAETRYVGEVIIVGNTITQDRVIRSVVGLAPGEILRYPEVRLAERNLAALGLFKVDGKTRPTIKILNSKGPFKDILITVAEKSTHTFKPAFVITPKNGFGLALVFEERNVDCLRLPTNIHDFSEGRAFRGGGQIVQLGVVIGLLPAPSWCVSFNDREWLVTPGFSDLVAMILDSPKFQWTFPNSTSK